MGRRVGCKCFLGAHAQIGWIDQVRCRNGDKIRIGDIVVAVCIGEALGVNEGLEVILFRHIGFFGWLQKVIESHDHVLRHAAGRGGRCRANPIAVSAVTAECWADLHAVVGKVFKAHGARIGVTVHSVHNRLRDFALVKGGWAGFRNC